MEQAGHVDSEEIRGPILKMGGEVESALSYLGNLLEKFDQNKFDQIHQIEHQVNLLHVQIDEQCVEFIAKYSPKATDLRYVFCISKMNSDLERVADQIINISYFVKEWHEKGSQGSKEKLKKMLIVTSQMLGQSLDSFIRKDTQQAGQVLSMDDQVDGLKKQFITDAIIEMQKQPSLITSYMDLITIARNLERIGDHATNIAENVIYVQTGADVRHKGVKEL